MIKKALLAITILFFLVMSVSWLAIERLRGSATGQSDSFTAADSGLICSPESISAYHRIMASAGRMTVGPVQNSGTVEIHVEIHRNYAALDRTDSRTQFIVAHKLTGELFDITCNTETCSFDEVSTPMQECNSKHFGRHSPSGLPLDFKIA